jgi:hypothetical protein
MAKGVEKCGKIPRLPPFSIYSALFRRAKRVTHITFNEFGNQSRAVEFIEAAESLSIYSIAAWLSHVELERFYFRLRPSGSVRRYGTRTETIKKRSRHVFQRVATISGQRRTGRQLHRGNQT